MKGKTFYKNNLLALIILVSGVLASEDSESTNDTKNESRDASIDGNVEQVFSSSTISEKVPDAIGMPQSNEFKPHHRKHKNPVDDVQSHSRSPVYDVVNQPCYSPNCGGYGPQDGYMGNRWQPSRSRYGPYQRGYFEQRRRGGYREYLPPPGYGPNYGSQYPDYGYGARPITAYPPERFDRVGGYGRPPYDDYFLG